MKVVETLAKDPRSNKLPNEGVAKVKADHDAEGRQDRLIDENRSRSKAEEVSESDLLFLILKEERQRKQQYRSYQYQADQYEALLGRGSLYTGL